MDENVVFLRPPDPIAEYIRLGKWSGHRQLETLLGAGRFSADRVVIDAAAAARQKDLIDTLRARGCELVLDTDAAELSAEGRFDGAARSAPWALKDGPLKLEHFRAGSNHDVVRQIARFAVEHKLDCVLAPTHALTSSVDPALAVDIDACIRLRRLLDEEGGEAIAVDYSLTIPSSSVRDPVQRRALITALNDLPFENLWVRTSGFGADATAIGVRRQIAAVKDFHRLGRPVIADSVGGLAALALTAFGAVGGVVHGVGEIERFSASDWHKPRSDGGGGGGSRVLIIGLDRMVTVKQMELILSARGARSLLSCKNPSCCPNGWEDTRRNPKAHYLHQRRHQFVSLSRVADPRRARHFLDYDLADTTRDARKAAQLKVADKEMTDLLKRASDRLDRMHPVLDDLLQTGGDVERSRSPSQRSARRRGDVIEGRR